MAKSTTDRLQRRGNRWYLNLGIPRSLRQYFLSSTGKPLAQIQPPLGDLSFEEARIECSRRTTRCLELFGMLRAGVPMTPAQIKAALHGPGPDDEQREIERADKKFQQKFRRYMELAPFEAYADAMREELSPAASVPVVDGETVSQAVEAWLADPLKPQRPMTAEGHRTRANRFIKAVGDIPLADVTRAMISDFLGTLGDNATRTRNNYQVTLWSIFRSAKLRGRYQGDNPAEGLKRPLTDSDKDSKYDSFSLTELSTLLADAKPEVKPTTYNVQSALQWAAVIGPYAGMRIEELAAMNASDIYQEIADESGKEKVWVFDVHNGDNRALKNRASIRKIPIHSELVRIGFLQYVAALPKGGKLFPGLVARESKDGKLGARLGEEFRDWLIRLGLKRDKLCYHSLRHNVQDAMDSAKVYPPHKSRILGHSLGGKGSGGQAAMTGHYGRGPGLKLLAEAVESIKYPGLRLRA
jgi:integrase